MITNRNLLLAINIALILTILLAISVIYQMIFCSHCCPKDQTLSEKFPNESLSQQIAKPENSYNETLIEFNEKLNKMIERICGFDKRPILTDQNNHMLLWLGVLFRHGDRSPVESIHSPDNIWPDGSGMLTDIGRERMFCYGEALRRKYKNFINKLKRKNIYPISSPYTRCIESNEIFLSGLIKPNKSWTPHEPKFDLSKEWLPIAINTVENIKRSWMLSSEAECSKAELYERTEFVLNEDEKHFINMLNIATNKTIKSADDAIQFYDRIISEMSFFGSNFTWPSWYEKLNEKVNVYQNLKELSNHNFARFQNESNYLRLRVGTFFSELSNRTKIFSIDEPKLITYSSHDNHIAYILQALELYSGNPPTFGSGMIIELRHKNNIDAELRLFYVNTTEHFNIEPLSFQDSGLLKENCSVNTCSVSIFFKTLRDRNYIIDDIQNQCQMN